MTTGYHNYFDVGVTFNKTSCDTIFVVPNQMASVLLVSSERQARCTDRLGTVLNHILTGLMISEKVV